MSNSVAILYMLPERFCSEIIDWAKSNISDDMLPGIQNKGREKSPHLTLVTDLIDEERENSIELVTSHGPFEIELGDISKFVKHDKGYDVIKIDVLSDKLNAINKELLGSFEVGDPIKPFSPHITLAYVSPYSADKLIGNDFFKGRKIPIQAFVYSDRSIGGRVFKLAEPATVEAFPIKSIQVFAQKTGYNLNNITSFDLGNIIIEMNSNKNI
jgi:2'-5' RNA ligase